jgi:hypothetical protein
MDPTPTPSPSPSTNFNDALVSNFNDLSHWIRDAASQVGGFVTDQTPLFIKEYLAWNLWQGVLNLTYCLVILLILAVVGVKVFKWCASKQKEDSDFLMDAFPIWFVGGAVYAVLSVLILLCIPDNVSQIVKTLVAPRVVLVEKIHDLVK